MRIIDADALKEKICNNVYPITDFFNSRDYGMFWTGGIEKAIDEAPTIEAEPVKHGKWIYVKGSNGKDYRKCTECLHTQDITGLLNYCPVCGAKMDEVEG